MSPARDLRHNSAPQGAVGAGLSSTLSSSLSSARRRVLALLPRHSPPEAPRYDGGVIDDLARWGSCIPSAWRQPDRAASRGQPSAQLARASSGSAPRCRAVALGEVGGMPHPARRSNYRGRPSRRPAARRGSVLQIDGDVSGEHLCVNADWQYVRIPWSVTRCR